MRVAFLIALITVIGFLLSAGGNGSSGGSNNRSSSQARQPSLNRVESGPTISGLDGRTLKSEDAALNSEPGNRTITGLNGLEVFQTQSKQGAKP